MTFSKHALDLRIAHWYGMAQNAFINIADDTVLDEAQLAGFLPESEQGWFNAPQCEVRWRDSGLVGGWWLECHGRRWACAVNDVPLHDRNRVLLQPGDRIELGMLHLEVAVAEVSDPVSPDRLSTTAQEAVMQDTAVSLPVLLGIHDKPLAAATDANLFDIIPLSFATDDRQGNSVSAMTPSLSDQDIIHGRYLDANTLAKVDRAADVKAQSSSVRSDTSGLPASDDIQGQDDGVASQSGRGDIIDALGRDFNRAVQNVHSPRAPATLQSEPDIAEISLSTPAELAAPVPEHVSLEDLVSGAIGIGALMAQFGAQEWTLPLSGAEENVLQLFAHGMPESTRHAPLPPLTRREHHAFSPDSAYRAASAVQSGEPGHRIARPDSTNQLSRR